MNFQLSQEQYEALIALSREGTKMPNGTYDLEKSRQLDSFLKIIEKANGVIRSIVWVQWQEADAPLPPGTSFPEKWPPELRRKIELVTRPVARVDVDTLLAAHAKTPMSVLVTKDPAGVLGYQPVDDFFVT
jgi:hypothetical protein